MLGVVMADLMGELWQAVAIAWACFGFGVILFRMGCRDWHARYLSKALLFLSPFVLTCFGVHATRENQELAAIVAARKSEAIDGRVYLASVVTSDCGDGYAVTVERYSDGTAKFAGQMPDAIGCDAWGNGGLQECDEKTRGMSRSLVPMQTRSQPIEHGADFRTSVF
jgi:hypothetical protein